MRPLFDPDIRAAAGGGRLAGVIPVGSTEQHGPHLPVSTDSDIVTEVARRVSEDNGFLLLPTVGYGVSFEHAPYFNMSIRGSTLQAILDDLCGSLAASGIRTVFVINGHHGNMEAIKKLGFGTRQFGGGACGVFPFHYWEHMGEDFDHAGFVETSLMLAVSDDARMDRAERGVVTDGMPPDQIRRLERIAQKSFPEASGNGIWGDPMGATREDGQRILAEVVGSLGAACRDCLAQ